MTEEPSRLETARDAALGCAILPFVVAAFYAVLVWFLKKIGG